MNGEPQFLLSALRHFLRGDQRDAPAWEAELNWETLLDLADAHAVTPMLYSALNERLQRGLPEFADRLRARYENSVRRSLAQSAELSRLAGVFEERRIPFVALKGPMLSQYLYGALGARSSGDIDLLVKRQDVPRIRKTLSGAGYALKSTLHWNADSACLRSREEEISFESPSEVSIDVHWRLMPRYSASVFDRLTGWESLKPVELAGRQIQTLAPEPLLLFLCAHGAKHMFERLGWICDIARFLHVTPGLDWPRVIEESRRAHALRQLLLGVRLAHELLDAPAPVLPADPGLSRIVGMISHRYLTGAKPPVPAGESTRYTMRLLETPTQRLRCLVGLYLTPSEAEFRALKLPPLAAFLYYPFRPVRLVWRHTVGGVLQG